MPELPDLTVYREALAARCVGKPLTDIRLRSAFVLRSVEPGIDAVRGRTVRAIERLAKQLVFVMDDDYFLVLHLMITGRLHWRRADYTLRGKHDLAAFDFPQGTLTFTESAQKKRAALHIVQGAAALGRFDPGGREIAQLDLAAFSAILAATPHTLKRALTDQHVFAGIGNAYSDEILHRAGLSPLQRARQLAAEDCERLYQATRAVLEEWTTRLRDEVGAGFPEKVTAFRPEMAVHGKYRSPCPVCGAPVQRIVYAESEANYCARCQTGGRLLHDRALSRLLHDDWPKRLDDLEARPSGAVEARPT